MPNQPRKFSGRFKNLERPNVEWPIFRNFKIANIKITKNELFVISSLFFYFFEIIWTPEIFYNFSNFKIFKVF